MAKLIKLIGRVVDFPEMRLLLWRLWFLAGIPCALLIYTGFLAGTFGLSEALKRGDLSFNAGVLAFSTAGLFGIVAAAVRLANRADAATWTKGQVRFTLAGLLSGIFAASVPAWITLGAPLSVWTLMFWVPMLVGWILLIATISIKPVDF